MKNSNLRKRRSKNYISIVIFILLFFISIGYAALSTDLSINGLAFLRVPAEIRITNIKLFETENEGIKINDPTYSKDGVNLSTALPNINSTVKYEIEITNKSNSPYKISSIEDILSSSEYIEYIIDESSEIKLDSIIPKNSKSTMIITIKYKDTVTSIPEINTNTNEMKLVFEKADGIPPLLTLSISDNNFTITASDEGGSDLSNENDYKYYLSSSMTELLDGAWVEYVSGEMVTINEEGVHHIWVYPIKDNVGNVNDEKTFGEPYYIGKISLCQEEYIYNYTGDIQDFTPSCPGYYKVELWGAQGGNSSELEGGYGGYSSGIIYLNKKDNLFVTVGGQGENGQSSANYTTAGGYNGGGNGFVGTAAYPVAGGGGATHIAKTTGLLSTLESNKSDVLMVAAGGGGVSVLSVSYRTLTIGHAGGLIGYSSTGRWTEGLSSATGGSQTSGNAFGQGANGTSSSRPGGGGGYYGGNTEAYVAGGGSSFILGYAGVDPERLTSTSDLTNGYFIKGKMESGVNTGNGKAKITYIGEAKPERVNIKLNNVRYIKDCTNGNSVNTDNNWVELQAIKDGVNIALNKDITTSSTINEASTQSIIDGDITNDNYVTIESSETACVTLDLGNTYDLDEIAVWHYWEDNRMYYNNVTYVSNDNNNWIEVIKKDEFETSEGKRINAYEEE